MEKSIKHWKISDDTSDDTLISQREAARWLGITVVTLKRYRKLSKIQADFIQGVVSFKLSTLKKFKMDWIPTIRQNSMKTGFGTTRQAVVFDYEKYIREQRSGKPVKRLKSFTATNRKSEVSQKQRHMICNRPSTLSMECN